MFDRTRRSLLGGLLGLVLVAPVSAAPTPKASLRLAAQRTAYRPGETARIVARVTIEHGWHVQSNRPTFDYLIPTVLTVRLPAGWSAPTVSYPEPKLWKAGFVEQPIAVYEGEARILAELVVPADAAGEIPVTATLEYQACDDRTCIQPLEAEASLTLRIGEGGATDPAFSSSQPISPGGETPAVAVPKVGLAGMLFAALLGGLILNAMPCVLPVLSLKLFGLVRSASAGRREVAAGGLATALGILASFWALALAAIAARAAGSAVGWGVQFQEPGFVAFLVAVVALFSLNLWGLFEVPLPQRLARLGEAGGGEGPAGHFVSGLFATLMATPCSAPFLGTAVSFALAQPAGGVLAIFTAVGLGMAAPYLLLAVAPGTARFLPKPGVWMDTLKGFMGFLLAGAAVWLLYVLAAQISPERVLAVELVLLALGLAAWLHSRTRAGSLGRRLAAVGMLAACLSTIALAATATPASRTAVETGASAAGGRIAWKKFDRAEAEKLAAAGRLVFVDVTADWCLTCKVNERVVLGTAEVADAFARHDVVAMKADWTNRDAAIGAFLAEHGRYGIPFYLLYRPGQPPHVFGELLSRESVVSVLASSAAAR
ncbi:MAG: thioredoxin family protein [Holophagales bacterium]|nr:MAG: thioredoxin family protein [Holophagales bacterium]